MKTTALNTQIQSQILPARISGSAALAEAIEALLRGDTDTANAILAGHRARRDSGFFPAAVPPREPARAIHSLVPRLHGAEEDVAAAQHLLCEAVRVRSELLRAAAEEHGTGPFLNEKGELVRIVGRRNADGASKTYFLRGTR